jgi:hypothetical protein
MNRTASIVKKFLMSQPFFEDGFEYQFISVEPDEDWAIKFTVNVLLPKKGQSFVVEKFSHDIASIIENASKYIGEGISYTENILIEGKPIPENGVYINVEDSNEIIRSLNENVRQVTLSNNKDVSDVRARISFYRNKDRDKFYLMDSHQYIDFFIIYDIGRIEYNNTPVRISEKMFDDFGEVFNEKLQNSNRFRDELQDIIYSVLEPSIKINNIDVFINAQYWINKIDGMEALSTGNSYKTEFIPEMFIQTS